MPVSTQNVQVAECDAPRCTVRRVAEAPQTMPDGYQVTVQVIAEGASTGETIELWACRATHIGPAAQDAAHSAGWRDRKEGPVRDGESERESDDGDRTFRAPLVTEDDEAERDAQQQAEQDADFADETDGAPSTSRA